MNDEIKAFCNELHDAIQSLPDKQKPDWFLYDPNDREPEFKMELIRSRAAKGEDSHQCPICWMATHKGKNQYGRYIDWKGVHADIGLDTWDAQVIAKAADGVKGHDPEVRRMLLWACGLAS